MFPHRLLIILLCLTAVSAAKAQSKTPSNDGYELLKRVALHYAEAKSYRIHAIEEYSSQSELQRNWEKKILDAAEAPGNRYRYESESAMGHAIHISNGNEMWSYHVQEAAYTKATVGAQNSAGYITPLSEVSLSEASDLRGGLADLPKIYKSATHVFPDSQIEVNGKTISCYVLRVATSDERRLRADESSQRTIWIDKSTETIVRESTHSQSRVGGSSHMPFESERTVAYAATQLDSDVPDSLFTFAPPPGAELVGRFPDNWAIGSSLEGRALPKITFATTDGKLLSTEALRGTPVLLDLWASWCAPCVAELDTLAAIYPRAKDKLKILTFDQDSEPDVAKVLIGKKHYAWANIHDEGDVSSALGGTNGIPRTILVDAQGKVVYDKTGYDDLDLRRAISALGPEYAALFPEP